MHVCVCPLARARALVEGGKESRVWCVCELPASYNADKALPTSPTITRAGVEPGDVVYARSTKEPSPERSRSLRGGASCSSRRRSRTMRRRRTMKTTTRTTRKYLHGSELWICQWLVLVYGSRGRVGSE